MTPAVIVDAVRTPIARGKPGGSYSQVHPVDLHSATLRAIIDRNGLDPSVVDDVISGAVGQIGERSGNTARWAVLAAGLPESVPGVTVDRQCGSGQQAVHFKEPVAPAEKVNVNGGALAIGHPLGGLGARLRPTLLDVLEHTSGRYGLQVMCEAGGQANATIIERI